MGVMHRPSEPAGLGPAAAGPRTPAGLRWRPLVRPEWLVDSWFELLPGQQAQVVRRLHEAVLSAAPALVAVVKWGNLVYLRDGRPVAQLTPHRHAAHLQLPMARHRRVRSKPGRGPGAGTLRFRLGLPIDYTEVESRVRAAMRTLPR